MRYFKAFYTNPTDDEVSTRHLQAIHTPFEDKVFALPYHYRGYSDSSREIFAVSLIAKDGTMTETTAQSYLDRAMQLWNLDWLAQSRFEESTVEDCFMDSMMYSYSNCNFEEGNIRRMLNLTNTYTFISTSRNGMKDQLIEAKLPQTRAMERAEETCYGNNLKAELERIYAAPESPAPAADAPATTADPALMVAPITYLIENHTPSDAEEAAHILLGAMMDAGRIGTGHVFSLDVDNYMRWPNHDHSDCFRTYLNHQLIRAIEGNALIVRYGMYDTPSYYDRDAYTLLTMILDLVDSAACPIQLFLSVPEGNPDLVLRLRKRYNKPMVILSREAGTALDAGTFEGHLATMEAMAKERAITPDDSMGVLLSKRMREARPGQSLELEAIFSEWLTYHNARLAFPQYASAIDDAINLNGTDGETTALERLDSLIGLDSVKEHIRNVILRVQMNQRLMERGLPQNPFSMHMAFLGAPGTGKTEVARLYAEILKDEGVLSEGRLVTVSGGSGFNVEQAFEDAKGSVLFVDEAYGMMGALSTSITEFIAQMENHRDDTVVILAGYEGHMKALLGCNPGFRSRIGFSITFPDYTREELQRIFAFMSEQRQVSLGEGVAEAVRDITERGGRRKDQGNARFVRKLFEDAIGAQQVRLAKMLDEHPETALDLDTLRTLTLEDVEAAATDMRLKKGEKPGREALAELVGLDSVKELVSARMDLAKMQKVKRDAGVEAPFIPMHMAFKGNPGTGKTEVARLIGRILREEGVLSVGDFFECGKQHLVSPLPGGSADQIAGLFQEARGSVIFIDEAYTLLDGGGSEAVTALIDQMEKMRDEVVVIFAGYTDEIQTLLDANPGFASRVRTVLEFPDYSADELVEILHSMAKAQGYTLAKGVDAKVRAQVEAAMTEKRFGNARFMRNLFEDALVQQSVRLAQAESYTKRDLTRLVADDFTWEAPTSAPGIGFAA